MQQKNGVIEARGEDDARCVQNRDERFNRWQKIHMLRETLKICIFYNQLNVSKDLLRPVVYK